jgi:nucleotide-binding universal stress UspA family protein
MMPPKLILAPVDFSDPSRDALEVAASMAARFDADLLLVHVTPFIADLPEGVSIFKEGEHDSDLSETAEQRLSDLAATIARKDLLVRTELGSANDVGMELVRIAEDEHADMIIIATHGMTGWRTIPFGSVAKKVVEQAACPVLVLRAKAANEAGGNARTASAANR